MSRVYLQVGCGTGAASLGGSEKQCQNKKKMFYSKESKTGQNICNVQRTRRKKKKDRDQKLTVRNKTDIPYFYVLKICISILRYITSGTQF